MDKSPLLFVAFQAPAVANGGVESLSDIIDAVRGWPRIVLTQEETRFNERWRAAGCEVHVWPIAPYDDATAGRSVRSRLVRARDVVAYNSRVATLVRQRKVRVSHANDISALWHAGPGARLAGSRVVFNVRSIFPDDVPYGPKWSLVHHIANEVVCLSDEMREVVSCRFPPTFQGARSAPTRVIYTGIDLGRFRPVSVDTRLGLRRRLGIPPEAFAVGHVGRVWEIKNQLALVEQTAPRLLERCPRAHLYFLGDLGPRSDPYASACLNASRTRDLAGHIHWVGFVPDPLEWLQAFDATVLVSRYEGLARAMIESLACAVPMVSFDVTSAREILTAKGGGIVVPRGDYEALTVALVALAQDPALRERLARLARRTAETTFDASRTAAAYRELYTQLAGDRVQL